MTLGLGPTFTVKSLMDDLMVVCDPTSCNFMRWFEKTLILRRLKSFFGSLDLELLIQRIDFKSVCFISIFLRRGVLCSSDSKHPGHLFAHCYFPSKFRSILCPPAFMIFLPPFLVDIPSKVWRKPYGLLSTGFSSEPFGARVMKELIPFLYLDSFMDLIIFHALYWCKCKHPFKHL